MSNNEGKKSGKEIKKSQAIFFQDTLSEYKISRCGAKSSPRSNLNADLTRNSLGDEELSEIFFELANAKYVGYRPKNAVKLSEVIVQQDNGCINHTGGIVWETSYLLASFLESKYQSKDSETNETSIDEMNRVDCSSRKRRKLEKNAIESSLGNNTSPLGRTLEIGSGCGLLGLVLAASPLSSSVVLTETGGPLDNLCANVERNRVHLNKSEVRALQLNWNDLETDILNGGEYLCPHSFDTIVGTDVVFSRELVKPMLETLHKMSHRKTVIYLCLQERCKDAHAMLMKTAPSYFRLKDCTDELQSMDDCEWGLHMDCKIFELKMLSLKKKTKCKKKKRKKTRQKQKREQKSEKND